MALHLSPETLQRISEKVASGDYPDANTVIEKALDQLSEYEKLRHVQAVLTEAAGQVARGEAVEFTPELREKLWQSAVQRAAAGETPGPDVCP